MRLFLILLIRIVSFSHTTCIWIIIRLKKWIMKNLETYYYFSSLKLNVQISSIREKVWVIFFIFYFHSLHSLNIDLAVEWSNFLKHIELSRLPYNIYKRPQRRNTRIRIRRWGMADPRWEASIRQRQICAPTLRFGFWIRHFALILKFHLFKLLMKSHKASEISKTKYFFLNRIN